jgi:hypothetical protein
MPDGVVQCLDPATGDAAIVRGGEPFVFFEDTATGRGNVVYRRYGYDDHYGLISCVTSRSTA